MGFGRFVAQGGGTVVIGVNGARSSTGSVILLSSSPSAATFTLDPPGKGNKLAMVSLPPNGSVLMSNGSSTMPVNHFVSNAPTNGQLNAPNYALSVGATLQVGPNQAPGNYVGTFAVTVDYQ